MIRAANRRFPEAKLAARGIRGRFDRPAHLRDAAIVDFRA